MNVRLKKGYKKLAQTNGLRAIKMDITPSLKMKSLDAGWTVSEGHPLSPTHLAPHTSGHLETQSSSALRAIQWFP